MVAELKSLSNRTGKMFALGILLIVMFVSFILGSVIVNAQSKEADPNEKIYYTNTVVQNGDTLWDIANENMDYSHYDNVKEYMDELVRVNGLTSYDIYAGENLIITYYSSANN